MALPARRQDISINKGTEFYLECYLVEDSVTNGISLVGKTLFGNIRESHMSLNPLLELSEANGRLVRVDEANGVFAIFLPATTSSVPIDYGVYNIYVKDNENPTTRIASILEGKVTFSEGV